MGFGLPALGKAADRVEHGPSGNGGAYFFCATFKAPICLSCNKINQHGLWTREQFGCG